ncbi:MAG: MerR family transcriptional regulator [Firmicutes bacterium]|nr:MerR family transcriptional regulator [Bacillota bacterium]
MDIRNCSECGRVFVDRGNELCPRCVEEEDRQFEVVRRYVEAHANASVDEVSEETKVPKERIVRFLRLGRLVQGSVSGFELRCDVCGSVIETGRVCRKCKEGFDRVAQDLTRKPLEPEKRGFERMHTYDSIKKGQK